jgi:hypothetical protein
MNILDLQNLEIEQSETMPQAVTTVTTTTTSVTFASAVH